MKEIRHYLITRFNLYNPEWTVNKYGKIINSDEWMRDRWKLFNQFCLKSVKNQSNKKFQWLIFFDVRTHDFFKELIKEKLLEFEWITYFFVDGFPEFDSVLNEYVKNSCKGFSTVATTRLDNDDLIHRDFIKEIQSLIKNISKNNNFLISCPKGLTLQVTPFVKITKYKEVYNPFITLVENDNNLKTVFQVGHGEFKNMELDCYNTQSSYLWMQYIHPNNIANYSKGKKVFFFSDFKAFSLPNLSFSLKRSYFFTEVLNIVNRIRHQPIQ